MFKLACIFILFATFCTSCSTSTRLISEKRVDKARFRIYSVATEEARGPKGIFFVRVDSGSQHILYKFQRYEVYKVSDDYGRVAFTPVFDENPNQIYGTSNIVSLNILDSIVFKMAEPIIDSLKINYKGRITKATGFVMQVL